MTRSTVGWVIAGLAVLCLSSQAMAGAEADYKTLFGEDEEKIAVSKDAKASAEFAGRLLNAAKAVGEQKDLQILLCEKAYEFGMKDPSGYQAAIDAMKFLAEAAPDRKGQALGKLLEVSQLCYAKSTGAERKALGEEMVDLLVAIGDERAAGKKPTEAVAFYRRALTIATGAGSGRTAAVTATVRPQTQCT